MGGWDQRGGEVPEEVEERQQAGKGEACRELEWFDQETKPGVEEEGEKAGMMAEWGGRIWLGIGRAAAPSAPLAGRMPTSADQGAM